MKSKAATTVSRAARPFVIVHMSMTADGKIATANRAVSAFGSDRDQRHLHAVRATADAVLCGARTADLNRVTLGPGGAAFQRLRRRRGLAEFNLRVIASGSGSLAPAAEVFRSPGAPVIVLASRRAPAARLRRLQAVAGVVKTFGRRELDWPAALAWLRREHGVRRLVCEGGGALNDALFRAGLVDELHLTVCPFVIGGRAAPTIVDGAGFARLADAARLELRSARRVGAEMFLVYRVRPPRAGRRRVRVKPAGKASVAAASGGLT